MRFNEFKITEPSSSSDGSVEPKYVLVQKRDNLTRIAKALTIPLADLIAANPQIQDINLIHPGDRIKVPGSTATNPVYPEIPHSHPRREPTTPKDDGSFDNAEKRRLANPPAGKTEPKDDGSFDNAEKRRLTNPPANSTTKPGDDGKMPLPPGVKPSTAGAGQGNRGKDSVPVNRGPLGDNAQQVFNFFKSKGFNDIQAAAFVGNAQQESNIDPTVESDFIGMGRFKRATSGGIFSWHDESPLRKNPSLRYERLRFFAGKQGKHWTDLDVQLDYTWKELGKDPETEKAGIMAGVTTSLKSQGKTDIEIATQIIMKQYENPRDDAAHFDKRLAYAKLALKLFGTKQDKTPA